MQEREDHIVHKTLEGVLRFEKISDQTVETLVLDGRGRERVCSVIVKYTNSNHMYEFENNFWAENNLIKLGNGIL